MHKLHMRQSQQSRHRSSQSEDPAADTAPPCGRFVNSISRMNASLGQNQTRKWHVYKTASAQSSKHAHFHFKTPQRDGFPVRQAAKITERIHETPWPKRREYKISFHSHAFIHSVHCTQTIKSTAVIVQHSSTAGLPVTSH